MSLGRRAIFRCDAEPRLGGGHVIRCLALADELSRLGWQCAFASPLDLAPVLQSVATRKHEVFRMRNGADPDELGELSHAGASVILDRPGLTAHFESSCRDWASSLLVFEDTPSQRHVCDILVDQNLGRKADDYHGLTEPSTELLLGPSFAPLRQEFASRREASLTRREGFLPATLLVSLGLMDADDTTGFILDALSPLDTPLSVDVVLGTAAPHLESVKIKIANFPHEAKLHVGTSNMADLMFKADVAIGAGGITAWERCCLGLPALLLTLAENQSVNARGLDAAGAAIALGPPAGLPANLVREALAELIGNPQRLRHMSRTAATICDGLGSQRLAAKLATFEGAKA